jgi:hypothetical protein
VTFSELVDCERKQLQYPFNSASELDSLCVQVDHRHCWAGVRKILLHLVHEEEVVPPAPDDPAPDDPDPRDPYSYQYTFQFVRTGKHVDELMSAPRSFALHTEGKRRLVRQ